MLVEIRKRPKRTFLVDVESNEMIDRYFRGHIHIINESDQVFSVEWNVNVFRSFFQI